MILLNTIVQYGHNHVTAGVAFGPNWVDIHVKTIASVLQHIHHY